MTESVSRLVAAFIDHTLTRSNPIKPPVVFFFACGMNQKVKLRIRSTAHDILRRPKQTLYIYIHPRTSDCPNRDRVAVSRFFLVNLSYPYHQILERFLEQSDPADRAPSLSTECLRGNSNSGSTVIIHAGFTVLPQSSASSASSPVSSSFSAFKLPCRRCATSTESRRFITGIRQCGQLRLALPTQLNVPPVNVNGQGRKRINGLPSAVAPVPW